MVPRIASGWFQATLVALVIVAAGCVRTRPETATMPVIERVDPAMAIEASTLILAAASSSTSMRFSELSLPTDRISIRPVGSP